MAAIRDGLHVKNCVSLQQLPEAALSLSQARTDDHQDYSAYR